MNPKEAFKTDLSNWQEAFDTAACDVRNATAKPAADLTTISIDDVEDVHAFREGENDGEPWLCLGRAEDGRYFFLTAWCDYTGWDCQAGGSITVANDFLTLQAFGISRRDWESLGELLP